MVQTPCFNYLFKVREYYEEDVNFFFSLGLKFVSLIHLLSIFLLFQFLTWCKRTYVIYETDFISLSNSGYLGFMFPFLHTKSE